MSACSRLLLVVPLLIGACALPTWAASSNDTLSACIVTLANAVPGERPITLYLGLRGSAIVAAFGKGHTGRSHLVDTHGLHYDGKRLSGMVTVSIMPDDYVLPAGKSMVGEYTLDASIANGAVCGTFTGTVDSAAVQGPLSGTFGPQPDAGTQSRFKVRVFHPLMRLWRDKGPNYKYALDMNLLFSMDHGAVPRAQLETIVPDYRRYCAIVTKRQVTLEGFALTGTVEATIDTGEQGKSLAPREEPYVFTLHGLVIGDTVGGTYDVAIGRPASPEHLVATGENLLGSYRIGPPPAPEQATAWLRLHKAMGSDWPVLLDLSIVDGHRLHGLAFVSGYNHMPHAVDASGLVRDGDHLTGRLVVEIAPDCYRPIEDFSLDLLVDARILGDDIVGVFAAIDRGQAYNGQITGEVRAKQAATPPVTMANLAACELTLSAGLQAGKGGMGSPLVRMRFHDGAVTAVEVVQAEPKGTFAARVTKADLTLEGDRLTGAIAFTVTSDAVAEGQYAFTLTGMVNGNGVWGYWRGTRDGKDILVKSSKLSGTVTAGD